MAPKSIAARRDAARAMATKALIAKAIAARVLAAKSLETKPLNEKSISSEKSTTSENSDLALHSSKFAAFEKLLNDSLNQKSRKKSSEMEAQNNQSTIDNLPVMKKASVVSFPPPLNDECTVEDAIYPFKLVLTPAEERPLETSTSQSVH